MDLSFVPLLVSLSSLLLSILIWRQSITTKVKEQIQQHQTDIAVIKQQVITSKEQLEKIDSKLDDIIKELIQ